MGVGTGFMTSDDIVVVPYGCSTPILPRAESRHCNEYRYVGDVYIYSCIKGDVLWGAYPEKKYM